MAKQKSLPEFIAQKLRVTPPLDLSSSFPAKACVAAILRGTSLSQLEIAFIRRAQAVGDRWSGQVAFPGGKFEPGDADDLATATREVFEETGIVLRPEDCLGRLSDIQSRSRGELLQFYIRPFVFWLDRSFQPKLDPAEAADFFWVPLETLRDPSQRCEYEWIHEGTPRKLPAIAVVGEPPLWGLTYFMALDLLNRLSCKG